jgi:hypothetical protein
VSGCTVAQLVEHPVVGRSNGGHPGWCGFDSHLRKLRAGACIPEVRIRWPVPMLAHSGRIVTGPVVACGLAVEDN